MADVHELKFEYIQPTSIESEVPNQQILREPIDDSAIIGSDSADIGSDSAITQVCFAPVITVTKKEAVFTKGDLKLQKISVTEDISVRFQHLFKKETLPGKSVVTTVIKENGRIVANPLFSEIQSEVIEEQPIRIPETTTPEDKKPTRIPKFRQTVEKVKRERRDSQNKEKENEIAKNPPPQPRRSSIPRLITKHPSDAPHPAKAERTPEPVKERAKEPVKNTELIRDIPKDFVKHIETVKERTKEPVKHIEPVKDTPKESVKDREPVKDRAKGLGKNANQDPPKAVKRDTEKSTAIPQLVKSNKVSKEPIQTKMKIKDIDSEEKKLESNDVYKNNEEKVIKNNDDEITLNDTKEEDEFDKIYEEIIDTPAVIESDLNTDDPKSLDDSFEEIIHDYEENKIEPLDISSVKKKPFVKQISHHDVKKPKFTERRLSLEEVIFEDDNKVKTPPSTPVGIKFTKQPNLAQKVVNNFSKDSPKVKDHTHKDEITKAVEINNLQEANKVKTLPSTPVGIKFAKQPNLAQKVVNNFSKDSPKVKDHTHKDEITKAVEINNLEEAKDISNLNSLKDTDLAADRDENFKVTLVIDDKTEKATVEINAKSTDDSVLVKNDKSGVIDTNIKKVDLDKQLSSELPDSTKMIQNILSNLVSKTENSNKTHDEPYIIGDFEKTPKENEIAATDNDKSEIAPKPGEIEKKNVEDTHYDGKQILIPKGKVESIRSKFNSITGTEISEHKDIPKPTGIKSKIAVFNRKNVSNVDELPPSNLNKDLNKPIDAEQNHKSPKDIISNNDTKLDNSIKTDTIKPEKDTINIKNKELNDNVPNDAPEFTKTKPEKKTIDIKNKEVNGNVQNDALEFSKTNSTTQENKFDSPTVEESSENGTESDKTECLKDSITILEPDSDSNKSSPGITTDKIDIDNEEIPVIKGRVSSIISRLDSRDEGKRETPKIDIKSEVPIRRSVSSRVAMFERQASKEFKDEELLKPRIVHELLKLSNDPKELKNDAKHAIDKLDHETFDDVFEDSKNHKTNEDTKTNDIHDVENSGTPSNKTEDDRSKEAEYKRKEKFIEERLRRLTSRTERPRAKSVAEMDLGDAVVGKVQQMIVRINSKENLLEAVEKREVIGVKERPRKKSVSEKIALFERKLTPAALDTIDPHTGSIAPPAQIVPNLPKNETKIDKGLKMPEQEFILRVEELKNAKNIYGSMTNMLYLKLRDGVEMPAISLGTALVDERLLKHVVTAAIDMGYRSIDTAYIYGNEKIIGEAIREKIQDGTVTREDLFITNKLWSTFHRQDLVEEACRSSLDAMGLQYFDLYLIHNPMSFKEGGHPIPKIANVLQYSQHDYLEAWYGMEELVTKGLVRNIGVSNFNASQMSKVYERARVKPVINQVESHPYLNQMKLTLACEERQVKLSCFGVLGSKGTPEEFKASSAAVIDDPVVEELAAGLKVSPAQLLIRYQIQNGRAVVVKASSAAHLWDNLKALAFNVTATEMDALNELNKNKRTYTFKGMGDTHRNYPFRAPY